MNSASSSVLVEPFDAYIARRSRSATPFTPGEVVTAVVGIVRGCHATESRNDLARWWLTADGRPTLVADEDGDESMATTASTLSELAEVADSADSQRLVQTARTCVLTRPPKEWEEIERRLFRHASPRPLVLGPLTPVEEAVPSAHTVPGPHRLLSADTDLAEAVSAIARDLHTRWATSRKLRLVVVGLCVAAALLAISALMLSAPVKPYGSTATTTPMDFSASPTARAKADERVPLSDDVVEGARALLRAASACEGDRRCESEAWEAGEPTGDPLLVVSKTTDITMVDDFGGVTVVRVADATGSQYVTLIRKKERWLVRTVKTVADQPS